jgi:uncharacterized protein involved in response to NO
MKIDLYRLFFPIGWLLGFWGALVWILYYFKLIPYPGALHPFIMMGGFILSFVFGFLGTAAPKFTNSFPSTKFERIIIYVLVTFLFISQFWVNELYFRFSSLSIFIFLIYFLTRRFQKRTANPPTPFIFVGVGVLTGTVGSIFLILYKLNLASYDFYNLGKLFFYQAYILSFVLGIGSRLIPSLLGFSPPANTPQASMSLRTYATLAIIFLGTYIVEVFVSPRTGIYIRDLIILFIAFSAWKIHKLPKRKAIQAYGLWLSCIFMVLGYLCASFFPTYYVHFMHLFYISGLSLMTIMIASRVTLSHGGHDMAIESKSKAMIAVIFLFILAALTRMSAGFLPSQYLSHLFYAATVWIVGMTVWGVIFLPKMFKVK